MSTIKSDDLMRNLMMNPFKKQTLLMFVLVFLYYACSTSNRISKNSMPETDPLTQGFMSPPDSARPGVYWYFMDGLWPTGITVTSPAASIFYNKGRQKWISSI